MTDVKTLVFDTETNGMRPKGKNPPLSSEPALVQVAAIMYWGRRPVAHCSFFMQPLNADRSNATIPTEKFFIDSGITQETIDACGSSYKVGIAVFNNLVRLSDRLVAHNILFDDPVMRAAYSRISAKQDEYWRTPKFCTMKTLEPILKLPGKYGYKFPSLDESYRALVDPHGFEGAHDAMVDVEACAKVLWAIEDAGHDLWKLQEDWPDAA